MEGNYAKVNNMIAGKLNSDPLYKVLGETIKDTMQKKIVDSLGKSTHQVNTALAAKMLYLPNESALKGFIDKLQKDSESNKMDDDVVGAYKNWEIRGNQLCFREYKETTTIPAYETI